MTLTAVARILGRRRDVRLHDTGSPWRLTVDLHVRYELFTEREDEGRSSGDSFVTRPWTRPEQNDFKRDFARAVDAGWSHKWLLRPRDGTRGTLCESANICRWAPQPVDVTLRIRDVARHPPVGSSVHSHPVRVVGIASDFSTYHNNAIIISVDDLQADRTGGSGPLQVAAVHEVGHALGLRHPGQVREDARIQRSGNPNQENVCAPRATPDPLPGECYEDSGGDGRMVMGAGGYVRRTDYEIFRGVMNMTTWMLRGRTASTGNFSYYVSGDRPAAFRSDARYRALQEPEGPRVREYDRACTR